MTERPGVLVTGGTGHVGHLALQALAARTEDEPTAAGAGPSGDGTGPLVSLDVRDPRDPVAGVTYVTGDVRTVDLPGLLDTHEVGAVVHCAAIVQPPPGMSDAELHDIEVGGTERVLEACAEAGVEHVTVTSSGAAYGYHLANRGRRLTEDDPVRGSDDFAYSRHKADVERLLARYRRLHPELGQLVLRPGTILGAGTRNQITDLFEKPVLLGLAGTEVPFVIVWDEDVAAIIARGVRERITGIYNVAGDGVLTLHDIARIEGTRVLPLPPRLLARALGALGRLGLTQYGPEQVDFLRYRPVLANDALKRAFPGLPTKTTREAYEAYRQGRAARG